MCCGKGAGKAPAPKPKRIGKRKWPQHTKARALFVALLLCLPATLHAADVVATATGNFTSSATWSATSHSLVSTSSSTTALTTSSLDSATFVPTNTQVQGFMVRFATRAAGTPTNTITLTLRNSTTATDTCPVTANVSSLPSSPGAIDSMGWLYFKCASTFTPNGTDSYVIRAILSATSTAVSMYTNGTANNWQRLIVTTTAATPAGGDDLFCSGEWSASTNPATLSAYTVTMDSTAATDYGSNSTSARQAALQIAKNCTMSYGTSAATNYVLRLSGHLLVYDSGTLNIGSNGAAIPNGSTAVLEFDVGSHDGFGLITKSGGTTNIYGFNRGRSWTLLAANAAAAATSITVANNDLVWKNGDSLLIPQTTPQSTLTYPRESEIVAMSADGTGTSLSVGALAFAHQGDTAQSWAAEVANLTRNVTVKSVTSTVMTFVQAADGSIVHYEWALFRYMGTGSATAGVSFANVSAGGSASMTYCTVRDGVNVQISIAQPVINVTIDNNIVWSDDTVNATVNAWPVYINMVGTGATLQFTNNVVVDSINAQGVIVLGVLQATGVSLAGNHAAGGGGYGFLFTSSMSNVTTGESLTFEDWVAHGNRYGVGDTSTGVDAKNIIFDGLNAFGNDQAGVYFAGPWLNVTFRNSRIVGNGVTNTFYPGIFFNGYTTLFTIEDSVISGYTRTTTSQSPFQGYGLALGGSNISSRTGAQYVGLIRNTTFGALRVHNTADINPTNAVRIQMDNVSLGSTTEVSSTMTSSTNGVIQGSYITSQRHDQTDDTHKTFSPNGVVSYSTSGTDCVSPPCAQLTPVSASRKLDSEAGLYQRGFRVVVADGQTATISVQVRKSASYNGNQPRLVVKRNDALGITSDTVLDTMTVGTATFEELTGATIAVTDDGVLDVVIDCDGTAGYVTVDDWDASVS